MTLPNNSAAENTLETQIRKLGLRSLDDGGLSDFLLIARKNKWSPRKVISEFVKMELQERERRSLQWRMRDSKILSFKPITDYDWNWPKRIDRAQIEKLVDADFVYNAENVVLVGTPGVGKTMIAKILSIVLSIKDIPRFLSRLPKCLITSAPRTRRVLWKNESDIIANPDCCASTKSDTFPMTSRLRISGNFVSQYVGNSNCR